MTFIANKKDSNDSFVKQLRIPLILKHLLELYMKVFIILKEVLMEYCRNGKL